MNKADVKYVLVCMMMALVPFIVAYFSDGERKNSVSCSMTDDQMIEMGYVKMHSPVKGDMFIKQNGTVLYFKTGDKLQLPSGRVIENPTEEDLKKEYSEFVSFPKIKGCPNCAKPK